MIVSNIGPTVNEVVTKIWTPKCQIQHRKNRYEMNGHLRHVKNNYSTIQKIYLNLWKPHNWPRYQIHHGEEATWKFNNDFSSIYTMVQVKRKSLEMCQKENCGKKAF